jgi:hypothetical protein
MRDGLPQRAHDKMLSSKIVGATTWADPSSACSTDEGVMLFHVSEERGIELFEPRESGDGDSLVWAIDADRLRNYLVPRECPRVTFYAGPATTRADIRRFLGLSKAVIAIEEAWIDRVRSCRLYCYHMPRQTFECVDECAGYFVSRLPVAPTSVEVIDDVLTELSRREVELQIAPNLWPLRDAVVSSSVRFSIIRMRNALPRPGPRD